MPSSRTSAPATAIVDNYLASLTDVRPSQSDVDLHAMLRTRHPDHAAELIQELGIAPSSRGAMRIYELKNQQLDLTLDLAVGHYGDRLRAWLQWFTAELVPTLDRIPQRVLDLGCECGVLTCFYARLWPEAEVVGVDRVDAALARGRELAAKLGLSNVRFEKADLARRKTPVVRDVDLAISTLALGHEVHRGSGGMREHPALLSLRDSLRQGATVVSQERLTTSAATVEWARSLESHGLTLDLSRSPTLSFHELGMAQSMPVLVAVRQDGGAVADPHLIAVARETIASPAHGTEKQLDNALAAAVFEAIADRCFVRGAMVPSAYGADASWHELWTSGPLVLLRRWSTDGSGVLVFDSAARLPGRLAELEREFGDGSMADLMGAVTMYDAIEDRPTS